MSLSVTASLRLMPEYRPAAALRVETTVRADSCRYRPGVLTGGFGDATCLAPDMSRIPSSFLVGFRSADSTLDRNTQGCEEAQAT